jgi:hypothetical protein
VATFDLAEDGRDESTWLPFYEGLRTRLEATRDVEAVVVRQRLGSLEVTYGQEVASAQAEALAGPMFRLGLLLDKGRFPAEEARSEVVVNRWLAAALWPGQEAVGRQLALAQTRYRVVGVVHDRAVPGPVPTLPANRLYLPLAGGASSWAEVFIKYRTSIAQVGKALFPALAQIDERVLPQRLAGPADNLNLISITLNIVFRVLAAVVGFAVLLALIGIYGLVSDSVRLRGHEIGLRRALGAADSQIIRELMLQVGRQMAWGLALGLAVCGLLALAAAPALPLGWPAFAFCALAVGATVAAVVLAAALVPALRAVRREPQAALRDE